MLKCLQSHSDLFCKRCDQPISIIIFSQVGSPECLRTLDPKTHCLHIVKLVLLVHDKTTDFSYFFKLLWTRRNASMGKNRGIYVKLGIIHKGLGIINGELSPWKVFEGRV